MQGAGMATMTGRGLRADKESAMTLHDIEIRRGRIEALVPAQ